MDYPSDIHITVSAVDTEGNVVGYAYTQFREWEERNVVLRSLSGVAAVIRNRYESPAVFETPKGTFVHASEVVRVCFPDGPKHEFELKEEEW